MSNPILRLGSKGESVKKVQNILNGSGAGSLTLDGNFGPQTEQTLKQFQSAKGLVADGVVGEKTWVALSAVVF